MDKLRYLGLVLIVASSFWALGLWGQRIENALQSPGVRPKGWWAWLFGIRPGKGEKICMWPALLQIWAVLYLVAGFLTVWAGCTQAFASITVIYIFGFPFYFWLIVRFIIWFKRK
ncbi:MAG: hypothetical protein J7575_10625 [Chloroflexi bacterium]|jgi:hypothetical protein|nr:hypothetical protein [Chloroflexota bacterium]